MDKDIRDLLADDDLFDPLADEDEVEGELEQVGIEEPVSSDAEGVVGAPLQMTETEIKANMTAEERIDKLLDGMRGQRKLLLRLIDYCREPKTGEEMDAYTLELKQYCYSVYSPVILRELLEEAGAIEYLEPESNDEGAQEDASAEEEAVEPAKEVVATAPQAEEPVFDGGILIEVNKADIRHETLVENGEEVTLDYLEVEEKEPGLWVATAAGLAAVDAVDELEGTRILLAKEPQYLDIYHQIMSFCAEEEHGRSMKELDNLVNDSPLLEKPRRYSGYFVSRLEREGGLEWKNGWCITEVGQKILAEANEKAQALGEAIANA